MKFTNNSKYEYKSIAFIANDGMVEANIYQKAFKYNHLYNVKGNNLIEIANAKLMKTKESFNAVRDCASFLQKRDLEIIVTPEINVLLLYTEFGEYFKDVDEPTIICMFGDHQPNVGDDFLCLLNPNLDFSSFKDLILLS